MLGFLDIQEELGIGDFLLVLSMADLGSGSQPAELSRRSQDEFQERKVRTVPWMLVLHTGQSLKEGAQRTQEQRWPQGRKTTPTSPSMQILQVLCSFSLAFSDSRSSFGDPGAEFVAEVEFAFLLLLEASSFSSEFLCIINTQLILI